MIGETIAKNLIERYNPASILFCPYKEEMWDSMKTIYDYFKDTDVHTGIMPIAYYSLTNGRMNDITIEFKEYSHGFPMMLKQKWDIIVFHYQYDNMNNVTRPVLYSNELKAFCKHLVLVPYAVVGGRLPELDEVLYAGTRNSDLVICETEEQAKRSNELLKGQPNWNGECVGWGSAKYDMVELAEIPNEWKEKAEGRKVILLQTSLTPYLKNRNKLNQIESIVNTYAGNDKVCLIWRPHPLMIDTIKAHHKEELRRYLSIVEIMKKSKKDIFDETPAPESSIKFADEMISDASSMIFLWNKTGKKLKRLE